MKVDKIIQYIENEKDVLIDLEEELSNLEGRWFKTGAISIQTDFLKYYIKEKKKFIEKLKLNGGDTK